HVAVASRNIAAASADFFQRVYRLGLFPGHNARIGGNIPPAYGVVFRAHGRWAVAEQGHLFNYHGRYSLSYRAAFRAVAKMAGAATGVVIGIELRRRDDAGAVLGAIGDQAVHLFPVLGNRNERSTPAHPCTSEARLVVDIDVLRRRPSRRWYLF